MKRSLGLLVFAVLATIAALLPGSTVSAQGQVFVDARAGIAATDVVNGRIVSTTSVELDGEAFRVSEIEVMSALKGSLTGTILVETPGGERADGTVVYVSHTPRLEAGELVQLALTSRDDLVGRQLARSMGGSGAAYSVVNGTEGAYGLLPDGVGRAEAVGDYVLGGARWPDFAPPVRFFVNPDNNDVSRSAAVSAVRRAFDTWENDPGSNVDFTYGGTTTKTGLDLGDEQNTVSWVDTGANWLAQASWIATGSGEIISFDVRVNNSYRWANGTAAGRYDIGTVVAHEVGHGIGLGHAPASEELMYFQISSGRIKPLGAGDRSGARALYPDPDFGKVVEPGHSIDTNTNGQTVKIAITGDGRLQINRDLGAGYSGWTTLGAGDWASADVSIAPNGTVYLAAVKNFGVLYTRRWRTSGWDDWVDHGGGWDGSTMPSIASNSTTAFLGAIRSDGALRTATGQASWSGFTNHGVNTWAHVDVDIASDGDLWWIGTKEDGRLYLRKHLGAGWSGYSYQGRPTWSNDTAPAIAANADGVVFAAVKADGLLYTRRQAGGAWQSFQRHGVNSWAAVDIAMTEAGTVWLAATKSWGRLYTRSRSVSGAWSGWGTQGADTWSNDADPSISIGAASQPILFAVKTSGLLYERSRLSSGWGAWISQGDAVWAAGS